MSPIPATPGHLHISDLIC